MEAQGINVHIRCISKVKNMTATRINVPQIGELNAEGPNEKDKEKLMLFGQFVGDWDILECRFRRDDGTWDTTHGELHWGWILNGKAVQDVWKGVAGEEHEPADLGTTVRFYSLDLDAWHSIWISPTQDRVLNFVGRKVDEEIVLEAKDTKGKVLHWIFYDITADQFKWRAEESSDGVSWQKTEEMLIRRRSEGPTH